MISKKKEKVDKGFVLNYHRLSYRRWYIRNLWGLPFIIIVYLGLFVFLDLSKTAYIVLAIALLIFPIELIYNFIKWKKTEQ